METLLFFNDRNLYLRDGFTRLCGEVTPLYDCAYQDGLVYAAALPHVFRQDGRYYMLYGGYDTSGRADKPHCFLMAESDDGLHFTPSTDAAARAGLTNAVFGHEFLDRITAEAGTFITDERNHPEERYKLFMCSYEGRDGRLIDDYLVTAGTDRVFRDRKDLIWNSTGTEPCMGVCYDRDRDRFLIAMRPDGGNRKVVLTETRDFRAYAEPRLIMEADGGDEPLAEIYGLMPIHYKGWFVGLVTKYVPDPHQRERRYRGGHIFPETAFSRTGDAFQRGPRQPLIPNGPDGSPDAGMIFVNDFYRDAEGRLTLLAACCTHEHGHFRSPEGCAIIPYRLREDGFVRLHTDGEGTLCTNTLLFGGGALTVNLKAARATCALYSRTGENTYAVIPGYDHGDCVPFSGDSTAWEPDFGRSLGELKGRILLAELRITGGDVYAVAGDFTPMQYLDCIRYDWRGCLPQIKGMN